VGRETELARLYELFIEAVNGERQVIFVTGEPGIGKTSLIEAFRQRLESGDWELGTRDWRLETSPRLPASSLKPQTSPVSFAHGQCIEQYGAGEAYLPVLDALGRLARNEAGTALKAVLAQYAPSWLLHLPALLSAEEAAALQPRVLGVMQERMVRELAEALEVLTATQPLILVFEDLHWADASTLTLLSVLAHRQEPARLLILGTYRVSEAAREGSPLARLTRELAEHHRSREVALSCLDAEAIGVYLATRFPVSVLPARLAHVLYRHTEGNPLFVVSVVQDLIARGVITQSAGTWTLNGDLDALTQETPEGIRQLVNSQRARLPLKTRRILEAASVAGMEFSAAEVAAALETAVAVVEEHCARLAEQQQFLRPAGISEWPDHTASARYAFLHAVYQAVWHERVTPTRLQEWHRRIGERKEAAYGEHTGEIAAELAVHFEQGRRYDKVLYYLQQAAAMTLRRSANPEAVHYLQKALEMLKFLPDTPERAHQELQLQVSLGAPLMMTRGYTAPEVKSVYDRAWELCQEIGETAQLFPVLVGLSRFYYGRNSSQRVNGVREKIQSLAQHGQDPSLMLVAHMMLGGNLFFQGDFVRARAHAEQGLSLYDPRQHRSLIFLYGDDPEVLCLCWAALALWYLGYPDQALDKIAFALRRARELAHPFSLAFASFWTAFLHQARGTAWRTQEETTALMTHTQAQSIPQFLAMGAILRGWALAEQGQDDEGAAQIQQGLAGLRAMRQELGRPYFLALLAKAYSNGGHAEEGLKMLTQALEITQDTGECMHQAELWRLKGELLLAQGRR
jgi:predicted ATPase